MELANGYLLELLKLEFASKFETRNHQKKNLGEAVTLWKKTVKPNTQPDKLWEHYSIPAFDAGAYPSFELGSSIKSGKYTVLPNSVLVSKLNPTTPRLWIPQIIDGDNAICSTEFMEYVPNNPVHFGFYCSALMQDRFFSYLAAHVTGSTGSRQRVHPTDTLSYKIPTSDPIEIDSYCAFASPIIARARIASLEAKQLTQLRDALLPKLMSGEIDVSKVELPKPPNSHLCFRCAALMLVLRARRGHLSLSYSEDEARL